MSVFDTPDPPTSKESAKAETLWLINENTDLKNQIKVLKEEIIKLDSELNRLIERIN